MMQRRSRGKALKEVESTIGSDGFSALGVTAPRPALLASKASKARLRMRRHTTPHLGKLLYSLWLCPLEIIS